ncbi:MAG: KH domain-containing protein [Nanoarchaeota archaeon]
MTDPSPPLDSDMPVYSNTIKVPKDRVGVIIGKEGEVKAALEAEFKVRMKVDSTEGDVIISGQDSLSLYVLSDIIKAIARGFNPDIAMRLKKQDAALEIINLGDFVPNKNHLPRVRGRLIGTKGKARRTLEELTQTSICVYGKTISIIGEAESVGVAKRAVESLLSGSPHSTVFKWLEKLRRELKLKDSLI